MINVSTYRKFLFKVDMIHTITKQFQKLELQDQNDKRIKGQLHRFVAHNSQKRSYPNVCIKRLECFQTFGTA